jgi:hypothetical protein
MKELFLWILMSCPYCPVAHDISIELYYTKQACDISRQRRIDKDNIAEGNIWCIEAKVQN